MSNNSNGMTRRGFLGASSCAALMLAACGGAFEDGSSETASGAVDISGTYKRFVQGDDWGCGVSKVTLALTAPLDTVDASTFSVSETKDATDWTDPEFAVKEMTLPLPVADAYLVDANSEKTNDASDQVVIEISIDPNTASPFNYNLFTGRNIWTPYTMDIALADDVTLTSNGADVTSFAIDPTFTATETSADEFVSDEFVASDGTTYQYAHYEPKGGSKTLVVWLHGGRRRRCRGNRD